MIKRWMSFAVLMVWMVVSGVSAVESFDLDYPENVIVGEEFNFTLTFKDFDEDVYSVKIDILNGSNSLAQRFWDDVWYQNRWMYNATNTSETNSSTFRLKINEDFEGIANLSLKIKSDNGYSAVLICYTINISLPLANPDPPTDKDPEPSEPVINFEFEWNEEDIINNKEFEIDIDGFNLDDEKYDVKVWIEDDDDKIISEIYDEEDEKWKSGQYYVYEIFSGPGNESGDVKLRLKEDYKDFIGDANIFIKIRDEGGGVIYEDDKSIEILENEDEEEPEVNSSQDDEDDLMERAMALREKMTGQDSQITGQVIRLGSVAKEDNQETEDIKSENSIIYESSSEKIKKYSIFGFAFLCMMLSVLLIKEKL